MNDDINFAACNLVGKTIEGWKVKRMLPKPDMAKNETGGNFSICYIVEKDGVEYFMKVLDSRKFVKGYRPPTMTPTQFLQQLLSKFNYEKALSEYCFNREIKGVISYEGSGDVNLNEFLYGEVSYIVYEKADGDIRKVLHLSQQQVFSEKLRSLVQKLKSLHDVAVGLQQLHQNEISHQDIKPSNILALGETSKLGDLGSALCLSPEINCPYLSSGFWGDLNYAPPEAIFSYMLSDEKDRLYQMDNYMLGSLIVFYICGVSFNALMNQYLPEPMLEMSSKTTYGQIRSSLTDAYAKALLDFENDTPMQEIKEDLVDIVRYLCNPIVEKRGHPKNTSCHNRTPNYDLYRTFTELDKLHKRAELKLSGKWHP